MERDTELEGFRYFQSSATYSSKNIHSDDWDLDDWNEHNDGGDDERMISYHQPNSEYSDYSYSAQLDDEDDDWDEDE